MTAKGYCSAFIFDGGQERRTGSPGLPGPTKFHPWEAGPVQSLPKHGCEGDRNQV